MAGDRHRKLSNIGDLLRSALKSSRLRDSWKDGPPDRRYLDLVEELMTAENEMTVTLVSALARTRDELERVLTSSLDPTKGGLIPFTAGATKVIELAEQAARDMGHQYVADAHVLIGLALVREGPASALLDGLDLNRGDLYQAVAELDFAAQRSLRELMLAEKTTAFEVVLNARSRAGEDDVTALHLLSALLANKRSAAVRLLRRQGVDVDRLRPRVEAALGEAAGEASPMP